MNRFQFDPSIIKVIDRIEFSILGNKEISRISALHGTPGIEIPDLYDKQEPKQGGLLDTRMGCSGDSTCGTCQLDIKHCDGHFGHIELAEQVFHVGFLHYIKNILDCVCIACSKILIPKNSSIIRQILSIRSNRNRLAKVHDMASKVKVCAKENQGCGTPASKIKIDIKKKYSVIEIFSESENIEGDDKKEKQRHILYPDIISGILSNISSADCMLLGIDPTKNKLNDMIHKIFPVPPVPVRPSIRGTFNGGSTMEDGLTHKLSDLVKANARIKKQKTDSGETRNMKDNTQLLQVDVAHYFDPTIISNPKSKSYNKGVQFKPLADRYDGKEGRIRWNLMGKRVNHNGRTVITGDPGISCEQVGFPLKMAMALTFPERVTQHNIEYLKKLVRNGSDVYPGANYVFKASSYGTDMQKGIHLKFRKEEVTLQYGDVVERHLQTGDIILLNRQPSLHKHSMMGHTIKVINNPNLLTHRLNLTVTKSYNADFDGDEMNGFIPQSVQSQIELEEIACVKKLVITPSTSKAILGIVQDGIVGAYGLTNPSTELDWRTAMNLISYTTHSDYAQIKKEGTIKGSDIASIIIPKCITLRRENIEIIDGVITRGQLSTETLGPLKNNTIIKLAWDEYGEDETIAFINNVQRLAVNFNIINGFTISAGDLYIDPKIKNTIRTFIATITNKVDHSITYIENNPNYMTAPYFEQKLFNDMNTIRDDVSKMILEHVPKTNNFATMIQSGARGNPNNIGQIIGCVGLQAFEGSLYNKRYMNRTLPYFHENDDRAVSRGLIVNSYTDGMTFPEFIYHTAAGREGIIDQVVKTSDTGYAQRKLIKTMEDVMIKYDGTVRVANNRIIQYIYGGNGVDTSKQYSYTIRMLKMNNEELENKFKFTKIELEQYKGFDKENEILFNMIKHMRNETRSNIMRATLNYIVVNDTFMLPIDLNRLLHKIKKNKNNSNKIDPRYIVGAIEFVLNSSNTPLIRSSKQDASNPNIKEDDAIAKTMLKIALYDALHPKIVNEEYGMTKDDFDNIMEKIKTNYNYNLIEPGEMIGIVSAQSLGEAVTQMTLNSVDWNEYVMIKDTQQNATNVVKIGELIDNLMLANVPTHLGDSEEMSGTLYLDIKNYKYYIQSVNCDGKISWNQIEAVTKHLPVNLDGTNTLIKITTQSGKSVVATKGKSFLTKQSDKIVSIRGDQLTLSTYIPFVQQMNALEILDTFDGFNLDYNFGCLIGNYIKNGFCHTDVVHIYNINVNTQSFANNYNIPHHTFANNIILEYAPLAKLLSNMCGDSRYFKQIPEFAFDAPNDFIKGLLFCYTGCIENQFRKGQTFEIIGNVNDVLINGIIVLFSRLGIFINIQHQNNAICATIIDTSNNGVYYDKIISIEEVQPTHTYVYDFTVANDLTFSMFNNMLMMDSFHHSGIATLTHSTMGVPRINELISATKNPKTPQMFVYLQDEHKKSRETASMIASFIEHINFGDIRGKLDVYYDPQPYQKGGFIEQDGVSEPFYCKKLSNEGGSINNLPWLIRIVINKEKMFDKKISLLDIKIKFCAWWDRRHVNTKKKKEKLKAVKNITSFAMLSNNDNDVEPVIHIRFNIKETHDSKINRDVIVRFIDMLDKFKLKGIDGINRVNDIVTKNYINAEDGNAMEKGEEYVIYTSGVNLKEIRSIVGIDIYKTLSDDVQSMYNAFGIEIARTCLINEFIKAYVNAGNAVNPQHVALLVDIMCHDGAVISADRHGMKKSDIDPLSKASFEKTIDILLSAAVFCDVDKMNGVSSRIAAGQVIKGGTGYCELSLDIGMIQNSEYIEKKIPMVEYKSLATAILKDENETDSFFVPS